MLSGPMGASSLVVDPDGGDAKDADEANHLTSKVPIEEERKSSPVPDEDQEDEEESDDSRHGGGHRKSDAGTSHPGFSADWSADASPRAHIFVPVTGSGRWKCVACRMVIPAGETNNLKEDELCRETFREGIRKYRENKSVDHHWVKRTNLKGKCKGCGKSFQGKLAFGSSKEVVGESCSWCKYSYHMKDQCQKDKSQDDFCCLGVHKSVIVPSTWILKVPRKGSFKSSLKNSPSKNRRRKAEASSPTAEEGLRPFCIKPIPDHKISPLLVFLNPKSGGNQGAKLMQKFQWLLNPRQVFDLTQGGPQPAIDMFRKVPNIKLLACGGDGTVGWLLSVLDKYQIDPLPAVGVLPLGTGNDLSRSLGWGGGYIDEPISKIISGLQMAEEEMMDRWQLKVTRNEYQSSDTRGKDALPLNVVNNYFSMGVDAHIALEFHEAREANPQKFSSRIRNKIYYGQAGGKDLLLRKWKDLSNDIEVICDGEDFTPKLRELRVHSVLFANIPSFGSGTHPWDPAKGTQQINDGRIEVIGLTTYQLPMLQGGLHGSCITQCRSAVIRTTKTISMQVDGEASRLNPATIELSFLNQVKMLTRRKGQGKSRITYADPDVALEITVSRILMRDYAAYHQDKDKLKDMSKPVGKIKTNSKADLSEVRDLIKKVLENNPGPNQQSFVQDWCFIDAVTAIRFFRIDRAQEGFHYLIDICDDSVVYLVLNDDEDSQLTAEEPLVIDSPIVAEAPPKPVLEEQENEIVSNHSESEKRDVFLEVNSNLPCPRNGQEPPRNTLSPKTQMPKSASPEPSPTIQQVLEKTTEGILKAARLGDLKMLRELHQEGYSLLSIDETGKTALHYGARFGNKEVVKYLIAQAPPSILDLVDNEKGQTALHKAASYKRRTISCMLVAAGASLLIKDNAELTPRQLAALAEDNELASYLESQEEFQREKAEGLVDGNSGDFETPV
ncbi:hypothetical protein TCAL_11921 [Tigriopus californicus]|uniref:Diacylglycerol kinase n=1 Tax=Tigriopus californicus TaxID=6832 RepID=A0A553PAF4_TIGCA|nr:eye-specific diacylglycerol kinase-like [Tigriopus californicus]TRY74667.1 hypothetical protein TCAL_11921 [Tigriopus californicus]|eukprot:TCALIF_11921-PA protein Name:"Similar to rdgA Eye-specific diacylglycerol kinase (Drosophila melanogaster)" AED:0.04 eAED:0.04 QI:390/1/1/1/0.87/0.77/9/423/952